MVLHRSATHVLIAILWVCINGCDLICNLNNASDVGKDGQIIRLSSNYFSLIRETKGWCLRKHHVTIQPDEDRTSVKKKLLGQHKNPFQGYLFDGSTLFTIVNACPDVSISNVNHCHPQSNSSIT